MFVFVRCKILISRCCCLDSNGFEKKKRKGSEGQFEVAYNCFLLEKGRRWDKKRLKRVGEVECVKEEN